jgi:hypothetical protein
MKNNKIKHAMVDGCEEFDFRNHQHAITKRNGELHLLIAAIDANNSATMESATLTFQNPEEGLQAFNDLVTIAYSINKTDIFPCIGK